MKKRLKKLFVPFIILPLITGGMLTFIVFLDQDAENNPVATILPQFGEMIARHAHISLSFISSVAAIIVSAVVAILISGYFYSAFGYGGIFLEANRFFIRNKSPPKEQAA